MFFATFALAAEPVVHPVFAPEQTEFYEKSIQPILAEHCYRCHGGGEQNAAGEVKVKSGLQLISRLGIVQGGDHGTAFNAASPIDSLLLRVISYDDDHLKMPPSGKLGEDERQALRQWVEMGLPWTPGEMNKLATPIHEVATAKGPDNTWTYEPLKPIVPPAIVPPPANPIDAFLLTKLHEKNLSFSPPASRAALIRRVTYDLTGLPPTPQQVADFVNDPDPQAYRKLTDALLSSPRYGEKYARYWLDLVRYAETNGFERDGFKDQIWRYRQWVIDSFNADKPYDQFIREQIAGDELTPVTAEGLLGTGYWNLMQWDDEPADREQHLFDIMDDNIRVTSEAFLGMTVGCARCHNHKVDPITQKDYYSFMAFMRGMTPYSSDSRLKVLSSLLPGDSPPPTVLAGVNSKDATYRQQLQARIREMERLARQRCTDQQHSPAPPDLGKVLIADSRNAPVTWDYTTSRPPEHWATPGFSPANEGWKSAPGAFGFGATGVQPPRTEWKSSDLWVRGYFQLTTIPDALDLTIYHDEDTEVYLNGQKLLELPAHLTSYLTIPMGFKAKAALQTGKNVLAIHVHQTAAGQFFDAGLSVGDATIMAVLRDRGAEIFTPDELLTYQQLQADLAGKSLIASPRAGGLKAQIAVEDGPRPAESFVMVRGNAHAPGDKVEPLFPSVFKSDPPMIQPSEKSSGRRRALAEWIASPQNPRTARVMVNRVWQWHFGRGLNPSSSDFGKLGMGVSHPELLDWLARSFIEKGWSFKELHRLILSSQAYQQAASYGPSLPEGHKVDPANALWWRFDMRRLTSEEVRDSLLSVSGTLNPTYGGESFFAELPEEVLATASTGAGAWGKSPPDQRNRRSVYMRSKRSLAHPIMTDFDQADTDNPCPVRFATTVPTQALNFLNSKLLDEQADLLANRLQSEHPDNLAAQIRAGLELVTQRSANAAEVTQLQELYERFRTQHASEPRAALERVCLALLNLNEFLFLD